MSGLQDFKVLANMHHRETLLEFAKNSGVEWEEDNNPAINWMRASGAMVRHLDGGRTLQMDGLDANTANQMFELYSQLIELHKGTMTPLLKSAMNKLKEESEVDNAQSVDLIKEAHEHLALNGGVAWADKIYTLRNLVEQRDYLEQRIGELTMDDENEVEQ